MKRINEERENNSTKVLRCMCCDHELHEGDRVVMVEEGKFICMDCIERNVGFIEECDIEEYGEDEGPNEEQRPGEECNPFQEAVLQYLIESILRGR